MGRGYSASRSKSKRPTVRIKRERSASLHALKKSIELHKAVTNKKTGDDNNAHHRTNKSGAHKDNISLTNEKIENKMEKMSDELQRRMLTLLPNARKRASLTDAEKNAATSNANGATSIVKQNFDLQEEEESSSSSKSPSTLVKTKVDAKSTVKQENKRTKWSAQASVATEKTNAAAAAAAAVQQRRSASLLRHRLAAMEAELDEEMEPSENEMEIITRPDVMTKYKAVGRIVDEVLDLLCSACVSGVNVAALCVKGDSELLERLHGIFTKAQVTDERQEANDSDHKSNEVNANALPCNDSRSQSQSSMFKTSVLNMRSYSVRHGRSGTSTSSVRGNNTKGNAGASKGNSNLGSDNQGKAKKKMLPRGICYPTNISVNDVLCNYAPFREEESYVLKVNDVVKIHLGAHLDGYPVSAARTIIISNAKSVNSNANTTTTTTTTAYSVNDTNNNNNISKDVSNTIKAASVALSGMIHLLKPGAVNNDITEFVAMVGNYFGVEAVEGVLSHRTKRWVQDGIDCIIGRRIIHEDPHQEVEECSIGENQVWNVDIAFTNNKTYRLVPTQDAVTLYRRTTADYYNDARLEQANATLKTIDNTCFCFPFHFARQLGNPLKAKMGLHVLTKQGVVDRLPVLRTKGGKHITARFSATVAVSNRKITVLCGAPPSLSQSYLITSIITAMDKYFEDEQAPQEANMIYEKILRVLAEPLDFANTRRVKADGSPVTKRVRVDTANEEEEEDK